MPSHSLERWTKNRLPILAPIEAAHASMVGKGPGRRYVTQQINQAFVMLLSSQFQAFCRDLHSECVDALVSNISPTGLQSVVQAEFLKGRKLDTGNPNEGNLGNDFNPLGLKLMDRIEAHDPENRKRRKRLKKMNAWRNAIGHQDFENDELDGKTSISLKLVKEWRTACNGLAVSLDEVMKAHLTTMLGTSPW